MALDESLEALAGEYVLGTLSAAERLEAQTLVSQNSEFATAVEHWTGRLTPFLLAIPEMLPPRHVRERIMAQIGGPPSASVADLTRRVAFWRGVSLAASAVAAARAFFIVFKPARMPGPGNYVAVLQPEGTVPAFVAAIDLKDGTISVKRLGT